MINEKIFSYGALGSAWEKVSRNKYTFGIDGVRVEDYAKSLETNLEKLHYELTAGTYSPLPAKLVLIEKENGKVRPITVLCIRDKIAQTAAGDFLEKTIGHGFSDTSFGFRKGSGIYNALAHIIEELKKKTGVFVKADIGNFFGSIDRKIMTDILKNYNIPEALTALIKKWMDMGIYWKAKVYNPWRGIPQGAPISPILSNIYLMEFDAMANVMNLRMARYADDMMILASCREEAFNYLNILQKYLMNFRQLKFNPDKIEMVPASVGLTFLGKKIRMLAKTQ
jgi:group II intron reverse transcriptase/maturase